MTFMKEDICLGLHDMRQGGPSELSNWPGHKQHIVRSSGDLTDALNDADNDPRHAVIILDHDWFNTDHFNSLISGGRWQELIIHGGRDLVELYGNSKQVLMAANTGNIGLSNVVLNGREGESQKGLVLGSANGEKDGRRGPVMGFWMDYVWIRGVEQQLMNWSSDSVDLKIRRTMLTDNGLGLTPGSHAEGFYGGKGGSSTRHPRRADIKGLYVARVKGEAFDMKVNVCDVELEWFEFEDVEIPYSGALTLCIDNHDGGHGKDNNYSAKHGYIHNVRSSKHSISAIETGAGGSLGNIYCKGVDSGRMLHTLAQAQGPNRALTLTGAMRGGSVLENGSTLTDKSKADAPMDIVNGHWLRPEGLTYIGVIAGDPVVPVPDPPIITPPTPTYGLAEVADDLEAMVARMRA